MPEVTCPSCGSDNLMGEAAQGGNRRITCEDCGHVWERVPKQVCPRCSSSNIVMSTYEGWAFDDPEEALVDTRASWEYVDKHVFRCRKCHKEWAKAGAARRPPSESKSAPGEAPITVDELWRRLEASSGLTFRQIRGGEFTFQVTPNAILPDRTDWQIPRKHIEEALGYLPLDNTTQVQHLFGPSYIYAILMDPRIRKGEW